MEPLVTLALSNARILRAFLRAKQEQLSEDELLALEDLEYGIEAKT